MEAATKLVSSTPLPSCRTHLKQCPPPSAVKLHEQAAAGLNSMLTISLAQPFPTSVLIQEQRCESKPVLHIKEDRTYQTMLDGKRIQTELEENDTFDGDQYLKEFQRQFLRVPGLRSQSLHVVEDPCFPLNMQPNLSDSQKLMDAELLDIVGSLKALLASKEATLSTEDYYSFGANIDESLTQSSGSTCLIENPVEKVKTVRSTRLLERQSKRRGPKRAGTFSAANASKIVDFKQARSKNIHSNDPLRLFLASPETKEQLTAKQESELIVHIKKMRSLEKVKNRLQAESGHEPTMVEWAKAVKLSYHTLQSQLNCGKTSGEKLVHANFRMVVHVAKQYQGFGLNLQDLMQEGSVGLMRSVERYKPRPGCRFSSYAYWWIKLAIRTAIYNHSRTIRLPVNIYNLMFKVNEAKRLCIQEGHREPTSEQVAMRAGITVERLRRLHVSIRKPLSMQRCVWTDQDTTFQEITADNAIETPNVSVGKQLMRNHVRNLLDCLPPKEQKVIRLRYGFGGGIPYTLAAAGTVMGLSDERIRKMEKQALEKLKELMSSQGLRAYTDLLV